MALMARYGDNLHMQQRFALPRCNPINSPRVYYTYSAAAAVPTAPYVAISPVPIHMPSVVLDRYQ